MPTVASTVIEPLAAPVSLLVMLTQPLIGLSLITGRVRRPALAWGITLNLVFVLMGEVSPSVFYLVIELALLTAIDLGAIGRSPRRPSPTTALVWTAGALAAVPFVTTLAPAQVIHEPGIILVTVATIAAATHAPRLLATTIPSAPLDPPRFPPDRYRRDRRRTASPRCPSHRIAGRGTAGEHPADRERSDG